MNVVSRLAGALGRRAWFSTVARRLVPLDLAVQQRTGGRLSLLRLAGRPYLVLTTTGRRSGLARSVPLLYIPDGVDFVVVGSNWGSSRHPAWSSNLLARSDARVREGGRDIAVRARLVTGAERDRLWRELIRPTWPAYDDYDERSGDREIRVFRLTPIG